MIRTVRLYGKLGKLFGKEWKLDVATVGEAIKAININTKGKLQQYLTGEGAFKNYKVCVKNKNNFLLKEELNTPYEDGDIFIIPTLKASGKNGVLQTIIGVVLIIVGVIFDRSGMLARIGIALALGGIVQMLTPGPKDVENRQSFIFAGNANTTYQNAPIGCVYGRALVAPMPVCLSLDNKDQNTYDGAIANIGTVGVVTTFLYSYKQGTATLCGISEFTDASIPPKKYRTAVSTGDMYETWGECTWLWQTTGQTRYSSLNCSLLESSKIYINGSYYEDVLIPQIQFHLYSPCCTSGATFNFNSTKTQITETLNGISDRYTCSSATGTNIITLSDEDTESDAINRLLNSLEWSAWQETPVYSYQEIRTTGFSFGYRKVRMKTTTTTKYNPNLHYNYSYIIQRRIAGSSDPWVDAETIEGISNPNSDGDFEFEINNPTGYESKIEEVTISL